MNPMELERHELIGLMCQVTDAKNKDLIGLKGKIIDETKNTLKIRYKNKTKILLKNQITLAIKIKNKIIQIKGEKLNKRPEERIKYERKGKKYRNRSKNTYRKV